MLPLTAALACWNVSTAWLRVACVEDVEGFAAAQVQQQGQCSCPSDCDYWLDVDGRHPAGAKVWVDEHG